MTSSSMCTACMENEFFSYRRDGITGRMAAFICNNKKNHL
ncbi:MAG: laccase domain-containing protein [Eubacteriales bacterium]